MGSGSIKVEPVDVESDNDMSEPGNSANCSQSLKNQPQVTTEEECDSSDDSDRSNSSNVNAPLRKLRKDLLPCPICDQQFPSRLLLLLHQSEHFELKHYSFTCCKCKRGFDSPFTLKDHLRTCLGASQGRSKKLGSGRSGRSLQRNSGHSLKGTPGSTRRSLKESSGHGLEGHPNKELEMCPPFFCNKCALTCHTRSQLEHHKASVPHTTSHCAACNILFQSEASLSRHVTSFHLSNRYVCFECERVFKNLKDCFSHMSEHALPNECPECCKQFEGLVQLGTHLKCHKSMVLYACNFCRLSFSSLESVKAHRKVQRYEKTRQTKMECNFCKRGSPADGPLNWFYHCHQLVRGQEKNPLMSQKETMTKKRHTDQSPIEWSEPEIKMEVADDTYLTKPDFVESRPNIEMMRASLSQSLENGENLGKDARYNPATYGEDLQKDSKSPECVSCMECRKQFCSIAALTEHYVEHVKCECDDTCSE